jgi:RND family efflux transporter MFP subunit
MGMATAATRCCSITAEWASVRRARVGALGGSPAVAAAGVRHDFKRENQKIDTQLLNELRIENRQRDIDGGGRLRFLWWALAAAVLVSIAGGAWWYLDARPLQVQTAVATASGASAGASALLQATGYVTARRQATVATQITGTLTHVLIEAGDRVQKGQVIARLEDGGSRASLKVAQAQVASAQAQVAQSQAQLTQAQADARRQGELFAGGMVSNQAVEQARTAAASLAAAMEARRREADSALAQLTQAQVNFDYTVVRAPFAGVVTAKTAQVGEIVSPLSAGGGFTRTGVCTIVDMDSLEVDVDVGEAFIGQVKPDMPAEAVLDAYPDWKVPAHVIAIVPTADRGKATVRVRVGLEQKDARMVPEMGVRVSFLGAKPAAAVAQGPKGALVPPLALTQREGQSIVFVVVDGTAQQRIVKPAPQDVGSMKLLREGVQAGERVVVSPPPTLRDGAPVRVEAAAK